MVRPEEQRTTAEARQLAPWHAQHADVAAAIDLAQAFVPLVRQRQPHQLAPWLARAATRAVGAWPRVATGLREDAEALKAGVTLPWSHGPVEGQSTRLNLCTRQRCGRARLARRARRCMRVPG